MNKGARKGGRDHKEKCWQGIGTMMVRAKRGIEWDRSQIRVLGRGSGPQEKKVLKNIGTTIIRVKRGIKWDRCRIRMLMGPLYSFFFFF